MPAPNSTPYTFGAPAGERARANRAIPDGEALRAWIATILPHWRCITGEGLRRTLQAIGEQVPIQVSEIPSGAPVLDWVIPPEWRVHEAYIALADGTRVVDASASPLHLVQYSTSIRATMTLERLRPHLHTLPRHPDWIPYRTDYYSDGWGFCLRHNTMGGIEEALGEQDELDVVIDADLFEGSLTYGEVVIPGETQDEILISAHVCHPALANDNASSLAVATALARQIAAGLPLRHTVRFLFAPGTIGAIAWLHHNRQHVRRIRHGLVLANLGDAGPFTYKRSRPGTMRELQSVDRIVPRAIREAGATVDVRPFDPFGYDERQFGSPGFDLPVGRLTRTPHAEYPEYHTSADDLSLIEPDALAESLDVLTRIVEALDDEAHRSAQPSEVVPSSTAYRSLAPYGEPQLGRRGLYRFPDGTPHPQEVQEAIAWVLSLGDGQHSLSDVAARSRCSEDTVRAAAARLAGAGLIDGDVDA